MLVNGRIFELAVVNGDIDPETGPSTDDGLELTGDHGTSQRREQTDHGDAFTVSFTRRLTIHPSSGGEQHVVQRFTGCLMASDHDDDGKPVDPKYRLAGLFTTTEDGRTRHGGWYATMDRADVAASAPDVDLDVVREQARAMKDQLPDLYRFVEARQRAVDRLLEETVADIPIPRDIPNWQFPELIRAVLQPGTKDDCAHWLEPPEVGPDLLGESRRQRLYQICRNGVYLRASRLSSLTESGRVGR